MHLKSSAKENKVIDMNPHEPSDPLIRADALTEEQIIYLLSLIANY